MRVLVVDDDGPILEAVDEVLTSEGFVVKSEVDSRRALCAAKSFHPDVALIDYNMPGLDGLTLARKLHDEPSTRDVPIVMMSAHPPSPELTAAADIAVLLKPFSIVRLIEVLRLRGGDSVGLAAPT